jgi:hypothetical protein
MTTRSLLPRTAAAIMAALLLVGCAAAPTRGGAPDAAGPRDGLYLSLDTRTSHDGLYRAGVVHRAGALRPGSAQSWTVRITDAAGAPVLGARLQASAWMPAAGKRSDALPLSAAELGGGRYRIDGLRLSAGGWWNVPVRISANGRTDSLAFNLVLPDARRGGGR